MWIFLNDAFLSIVDKDGDDNTLMVRARHSGDIERVFPEAKVQIGGGTDYRYRAMIGREEVAVTIAESIRSIHYKNFKNTVKESNRHDAYMDVWSAMHGFQQKADLN